MLAVRTRAFDKFNWALLGIDGALTAVFLGLFLTHNVSAGQLGIAVYTTSIGIAHIIYMLSLYRALKRRSLIGASLIGTVLFTSNIALLILSSGGFHSPYYALWLILTLAIGIYRPSMTLGLLGLSSVYFAGHVIAQDPNPSALTNAAISLGATYVTGGLGFWLWHSHHTQLRRTDNFSQLSQKLSQEQLKSEALLDHVVEGVAVVDATGRIQLLNPAGASLTGWPAAEAKGLDYRLVMKMNDNTDQPLKAEIDPFELALVSKQSVISEDVILNTRNGKKLALAISVSPIFGAEEAAGGAIAIFRDVSQTKMSERQRNEFISTASHEMRTPVAAVEGYVALALNPKTANIDVNARKFLEKAQASTQHLGTLFQDLLSVTRIEEGKLPSHPKVIEISGLMRQVIDELHFKAEKKGLRLGFKTFGPTKRGVKNINPVYYVYADPERLREVFVNLVDNAIKFTPAGEVELTLSGDDQKVTMGVRDSGQGIAAEDTPHLFQKFYRIDSAKTSTAGTGLGLYISRAIIEMYQGRIWLESAPGQGSHFKFSLPRLSYEEAQKLLKTARNPAPKVVA